VDAARCFRGAGASRGYARLVMTACPSCGTPVEADDRFCGVCGATLEAEPAEVVPAPRFCTRCGGPVNDEDRFCARCGATVRPADTAAEPEDEEDFFADWNLVFAEEPTPGPQEAITEAVPRPPTAAATDTSVLPVAPRAEPDVAPAPPPPPRRHPPPQGFPWGATLALVGAVTVVVSAILPWTEGGAQPREIPARALIDAGGSGGVNLGFVLLVAGTIGALVALLTMLLPWLGFLRRLVGIVTLAIPVLFVLRALDPLAGSGDLIGVLGAGVYAAGGGAVAQIVAGKWRA
jgi:RNA polymerase subunit RPABC4/transcription elongation factor Spt4